MSAQAVTPVAIIGFYLDDDETYFGAVVIKEPISKCIIPCQYNN